MTNTELEMFIDEEERVNTGVSWTRNPQIESDGYLVVDNLWPASELYSQLPNERGQIKYRGSLEKFDHNEEEPQVKGSLSRYSYPLYKSAHTGIRLKIEKIIGRKLYNTYYYDRFYFPGQELIRHTDRPACEISVTVHVSTNLAKPWPICIKKPDIYTDDKKTEVLSKGSNAEAFLSPGSGMIYKGCERPHWRGIMPENDFNSGELTYYHQVFFHYVLADGAYAHYAFDSAT